MKLTFLNEAIPVGIENKILNIFKKYNSIKDYTERGYILPNGDIVDNKTFLENAGATPAQISNRRHQDVNDVMCSILWPDEEKRDRKMNNRGIDDSGDLMTQICDQQGFIRVNGSGEDYIGLTDYRPSSSQYLALSDWIDTFLSNHRIIHITTSEGRQVEFDTKNPPANVDYIDGDYICKRIKTYYSTGALTEEVTE